jgi:hypothetical protein
MDGCDSGDGGMECGRERFLDPGGRIQPKTFHVFYLLSVLGNICLQIFFTISVSDLEISVNRYFKTDIFLCYTLSVYKDYKKQINSRRKTDIVQKKDGPCHIAPVRHRRSIRNSKKNIRFLFYVEQRHSLRLPRLNST